MGSLSRGIKGRENIVWIFTFFFFFKISNGIQKQRSRQLSDGNQFKIVINSIQSLGRIKRSFVLCYKPLSSLCTSDTSRRQLGDEDGCEPHGLALSDLQGLAAPAQLVLGSPCPSRVPLPLGPSPITQFWVSLNPKCHHHCRAQRTHPKLQLSTMEGMFPGRLGCPPPKATAGIWFQEWTAPGWEHDLMGESVWAPGLMLLSHSLSSVWGSLLRDWNFAHDCGVLDASIDTNHSERKDN